MLEMQEKTQKKYRKLKQYFEQKGSAAIAFSGGVDSTFLLKVASDVLGNKAVAVTVRSVLIPERELAESIEFCKKNSIPQIMIDVNPFEIEGFSQNPVDRCYICKKSIFTKIKQISLENGFTTVCEGSNMDDTKDYRPGMKAIKELDIKSPLQECELYKSEIRELSRSMDLPTWSKPSLACLATRFAYGQIITKEKLSVIDSIEQLLLDLGVYQVRVRLLGEDSVRIEVLQDDFEKVLKNREQIVSFAKQKKINYVSLDLEGYRTGSMNTFKNAEKNR